MAQGYCCLSRSTVRKDTASTEQSLCTPHIPPPCLSVAQRETMLQVTQDDFKRYSCCTQTSNCQPPKTVEVLSGHYQRDGGEQRVNPVNARRKCNADISKDAWSAPCNPHQTWDCCCCQHQLSAGTAASCGCVCSCCCPCQPVYIADCPVVAVLMICNRAAEQTGRKGTQQGSRWRLLLALCGQEVAAYTCNCTDGH